MQDLDASMLININMLGFSLRAKKLRQTVGWPAAGLSASGMVTSLATVSCAWSWGGSVEGDDGVFFGAEAQLFGVVDDVGAVLAVDALDEGLAVVAFGGGVVEDEVEAGLVKSDGVERGEDAHVFELGGFGVSVAVAVDRHIVHYVDIDDALLAFEVGVDRLGGAGHRLEELVLLGQVIPQPGGVGCLAGGVDERFTLGRCHADALIFQHAAEAAHLVALEVGEVDHKVVVGKVLAHEVIVEVGRVLHGQGHAAVGVHDVDNGDFVVAALGDGLAVLLGGVAVAGIGGVALDEGAVDLFHQRGDELGTEVVAVLRLARADFHGDIALCVNAQGLVDFHQRFGSNLRSKINSRGFLSLHGAEGEERRCQSYCFH